MSKEDDAIVLMLGLGVLAAGVAAFAKPKKDGKKDDPIIKPGDCPEGYTRNAQGRCVQKMQAWSDLKPGSSGETVKAWQKLLCGYFELDWGKYTLNEQGAPTLRGSWGDVEFEPKPINWADGKFGTLTGQITAAFQRAANDAIPMPVKLRTDGVVDRNTYVAMYAYFQNEYDPRGRRWVDVAASADSCGDPLGIQLDDINDKIAEEKGIFSPDFLKGFG